MIFQILAQLAEKFGVLGEFFHQDLARPVEHGRGICEAGFGIEILGGFFLRRQIRICQEVEGERLDAGFAGDLRLGAALLLVGQVEVFKALLGFGIFDHRLQFRRQLALFLDAGEDGGAALLEIAQVGQAFFQIAQLRIVQPVGRLLAVARDEGHGGAFVEQGDGGDDLGRADAEFDGDAMFDWSEHGSGGAAKMGGALCAIRQENTTASIVV